jgi:hypothetical protein
MSTRDDLDKLSSKELHDRAMKVARHHLDVRFLWEILREIPAAEAAAGNLEKTEADIEGTPGVFNGPFDLIGDFMRSDEGELADALRPSYIDYLLKHDGHRHGDDGHGETDATA